MTADLSINYKHTVGKRIAANTGLMIGAKFLGVVLAGAAFWVAIRMLTPVEFGTLIFLHAFMVFFAEVATFTSWQSIIRFGSEDLKNEDVNSLTRLVKFGAFLDLIGVIFAYLLSLTLFGFIAWLVTTFPYFGPKEGFSVGELRWYAALYCLIVLTRQIGASIGVLRLFDRFKSLAVRALIMPTVRFIGALYAALSGWGFEGFLIVWMVASLMSYLVMIGLGVAELKSRGLLKPVISAPLNLRHQRQGLWSFVIKSNIDSTLQTGHKNLPLLLVTAIFGPVWAGVYKVAEEVARLLSNGFSLLDQVIYPELAKLVTDGKAAKVWRLVIRAAAILLSIGAILSALVFILGPDLLSRIFGADYILAAPLASLLVPAAALSGVLAPLYPIFYATGRPERAIYTRGATLVVYVIAFLALSYAIGKMAPGWALLFGNLFAVGIVALVARQTLNAPKISMDNQSKKPGIALHLIGESSQSIWGLPLKDWQSRAYKKAGCDVKKDFDDGIVANVNWILSASLGKALGASDSTALVCDGKIIAINGLELDQAKKTCGQSTDVVDFDALGVTPKTPEELGGNYDKALRKMETPYALDVRATPVLDIMQRQFDSSYKGITDFVTKFIWPLPAFHVTRFCAWLKLTPNMVTTLSLIMVFAALYFFWQGEWLLGFATGWFMTFLDTVDGKLARTTMTYSAWGNIYDHGIDLIHPPFWYIAWFVGLGASFALSDAMSLALLAILIGYAVDRAIEGVFIALHGFHIHVWRPINSGLRFIIARRNPNMFIFMIGIIASIFVPVASKWGFYAVAIWVWACIVFNLVVVFVSLFVKRPLKSWMDSHA